MELELDPIVAQAQISEEKKIPSVSRTEIGVSYHNGRIRAYDDGQLIQRGELLPHGAEGAGDD